VADDLLKRFAKRFNFPETLSWPIVRKAVDADMEKDCSPKQMRMLELGMQYPFLEVNPNRTSKAFREYIGKALDGLRKNGTPIAMKTFEAITSGRVLVDELGDLTKHDFETAREGFAKDGVDLPMKDALHLKDGRVASMRRLNASIDGY